MPGMRQALVKLHLFAAVVAALFVVVLGLTGGVMAFEEELDHRLHPRLFAVTPAGTPLTLVDLAARATAAFPGKPVVTYGMGVSPDLAWSVNVGGTIVFVNEYTGEILGTRTGPTWLGQVHQLHLRLLAGDTGKTIVSWAGVLMVFLTLSGIFLWWPVKRIRVRGDARGWRYWFDLHNAIGVCSFVVLLALSVTGVVIGFDAMTSPMFYRATGSQPVRAPAAATPIPGTPTLSPDRALAIARRELPGAIPVGINVPGPKAPYRVAFRYPEDRTPGGRSRVYLDPYSGSVLQIESSRTTAAGTRLIILNRAIHTGDLFGLPTKILASLGSFAAVAQVITGLVLWRTRRANK
jgi:uncharacterized iron-regulated membrane protein